MVSDVLFELGTEELPSAAVATLAPMLAKLIEANLAKASLIHGEITAFASPRRMALLIKDLEEEQKSQPISRRGPACANSMTETGEPGPALLGFAKSCGVSIADLTKVQTDKGDWWAYESVAAAVKTQNLLPKIIKDSIAALSIAKPMRWGNFEEEFVRPVHWVVLLFGREIIPAEFFGIATGRQSYGHRFLHPQAIDIQEPADYESLLLKAKVIANFAVRRQTIVEQISALSKRLDANAQMPEALLDEVTSIVEWPSAIVCTFAETFLQVPKEALIASMQQHQKCFALTDKKGSLLAQFITVSNIESCNPAEVVAGNEKVMTARLSDAAFFYQQDKKQKLVDYAASTAKVLMQAGLGSLEDKALRIGVLLAHLADPLALDSKELQRAAKLCKCDLMTGMVGEFPELQGIMGYYYATHDGEAKSVAIALQEQYKPAFSADSLPASNLGMALSLADRIDTLVGNFGLGLKPTGMKDPYKLRRHALAVARILLNCPAKISLSGLIERSLQSYGSSLTKSENVPAELKPFILERLQSYYQNQAVPVELLQAAKARQDDWIYDLDKRIQALREFMRCDEAASLSAACKRVSNILQQAKFEEDTVVVDSKFLQEAAEKNLMQALEKQEDSIESLYQKGDYQQILSRLASLKEVVDPFFDKVMVMVDDQSLKLNRLRILARLQRLLQGVANIALLP